MIQVLSFLFHLDRIGFALRRARLLQLGTQHLDHLLQPGHLLAIRILLHLQTGCQGVNRHLFKAQARAQLSQGALVFNLSEEFSTLYTSLQNSTDLYTQNHQNPNWTLLTMFFALTA